jgi:hypothetical protein
MRVTPRYQYPAGLLHRLLWRPVWCPLRYPSPPRRRELRERPNFRRLRIEFEGPARPTERQLPAQKRSRGRQLRAQRRQGVQIR